MRIIKIFYLMCLFSWGQAAFAGSCTNIIGQISTISFGNIVVQRDTPVGTVIFSQAATSTKSYMNGCTNPLSLGFDLRYNGAILSTYGNHVYNTNIDGIGIRFSSGNYFDSPATLFSYNAQSSYVEWFGGKVELVVTGTVSSGILSTGTLGVVTIQGYDGIYYDGLTTTITGGTITALACTLNTSQLNFPIGDILATSFSNTVGTTPPVAQYTQNLGLNCSAGANINVSLSGTQNPDVANPSVLALTGQGNPDVAQGVGVQLLYNGTPLVLNNRIVLKQSAGGQETLPLTARYYQTKSAVSTGTANASATLSITYQ